MTKETPNNFPTKKVEKQVKKKKLSEALRKNLLRRKGAEQKEENA